MATFSVSDIFWHWTEKVDRAEFEHLTQWKTIRRWSDLECQVEDCIEDVEMLSREGDGLCQVHGQKLGFRKCVHEGKTCTYACDFAPQGTNPPLMSAEETVHSPMKEARVKVKKMHDQLCQVKDAYVGGGAAKQEIVSWIKKSREETEAVCTVAPAMICEIVSPKTMTGVYEVETPVEVLEPNLVRATLNLGFGKKITKNFQVHGFHEFHESKKNMYFKVEDNVPGEVDVWKATVLFDY